MGLWIGIFRNKVIQTVVGWKLINMINGNVGEIFGYCDQIEPFNILCIMLVHSQKSLQIEKSWLSRPTFCKCSEFLDVFGKFGESGKSGKSGKYKMCSTNGMARHAKLTVLA